MCSFSLLECRAGGLLSWFGEDVSASYVAGVKLAIGDYYNDQIREIYEHKPEEQALKEVGDHAIKRSVSLRL